MADRLRVGILSTHPVQYQSPLYRALAQRDEVELTVFYAHRPTPVEQGVGFGVPFTWDLDLLEGYESVFLANRSSPSTSGEFRGYDTPEIRWRIRKGGFDAFIVNGWHARTYWQAIRACWEAGVPVMVRGDSQLSGEPFARRTVKRSLYPWFMRRFSACLSVGRRSAEYFEYYGARAVLNVPHFVDNEFFGTASGRERSARSEWRARWGIPEAAFVALFAGKLVEKKRPLDLIHATAELRHRHIHVLIAGDGVLRRQCAEEARRLGVPVHFAGFLNQREIPAAYAASDVLVLPSDGRETWGLVVNEAMASALPVIVSSAVGCYPDLVLEGRTGYGFPLGDRHRLAASLARVMDSPEHRADLSRGAAAHVARFSVDAAVQGLVSSARMVRTAA